jgi:hypothetical protein
MLVVGSTMPPEGVIDWDGAGAEAELMGCEAAIGSKVEVDAMGKFGSGRSP